MNEDLVRRQVELETTIGALESRIAVTEKGIKGISDLRKVVETFSEQLSTLHESIDKIEQFMGQIDSENTTISQETLECIEEIGYEMENMQGNSYENVINELVSEDYRERIQERAQEEREEIRAVIKQEIGELIKQEMAMTQSKRTWKWQDIAILMLFVCIVALAFKIF